MPLFRRDDVSLFYDDAGSGPRTVVLMHGLGVDHTTLAAQRDDLVARGHRVVSPDFRGFGQSDKPPGAYTIEVLADDVTALCQHLGLDDMVLFGHSLGGNVALLMASRHASGPGRVSGVVIAEALVVPPAALRGAFRPVYEAVCTPAWEAAMAAFSDNLSGPLLDGPRRDRLRALMTQGPQHALVGLLADVMSSDSDGAASACTAPVLYVASGPWYTDVERFRALCPTLVTAQLVGCGHYFPMEVADQLNAVVGRFIEVFVRGRTV